MGLSQRGISAYDLIGDDEHGSARYHSIIWHDLGDKVGISQFMA